MGEQTLFVLQGPSGGGKTTLANELRTRFDAVVCSTDDFHVENGVYVFKRDRLAEFHRLNLERACLFLDAGRSVVVDNTNVHAWEPRDYVRHAVRRGVKVEFIRCDGEYANHHGVPDVVVERMRAEMEELTVEKCLLSVAPWEMNGKELVLLDTSPVNSGVRYRGGVSVMDAARAISQTTCAGGMTLEQAVRRLAGARPGDIFPAEYGWSYVVVGRREEESR